MWRVEFCFQRLRGGIFFSEIEGWNFFSEIEGWDFCFSGVVGFLFQWRVKFFFDDRQVLTCQKPKKK